MPLNNLWGMSRDLAPMETGGLINVNLHDEICTFAITLAQTKQIPSDGQYPKDRGPVTALVWWGAAGTSAYAEVDFREGTQFTVAGTYVKVDARNEQGFDPVLPGPVGGVGRFYPTPAGIYQTDPATKIAVGAFATRGTTQRFAPLTRTYYYNTLLKSAFAPPGPGFYFQQVQVPPFARSFLVYRGNTTATKMAVFLVAATGGFTPIQDLLFEAGEPNLEPIVLPGDCQSILIMNLTPAPAATAISSINVVFLLSI